MGDGIISGRILGNGGNYRALGEIQLPYIFTEITLGSRLHTQGVLPQVDGVHVVFQDFILIHLLFQHDGKVLLLDFTLYLDRKAFFTFTCPACKNVVLNQLLGDGTGALGKMSRSQANETGTDNTLDINSVMFVKTCVLNCHESMRQILGNLVHAYRHTVGAFRIQLGNLIASAS